MEWIPEINIHYVQNTEADLCIWSRVSLNVNSFTMLSDLIISFTVLHLIAVYSIIIKMKVISHMLCFPSEFLFSTQFKVCNVVLHLFGLLHPQMVCFWENEWEKQLLKQGSWKHGSVIPIVGHVVTIVRFKPTLSLPYHLIHISKASQWSERSQLCC